MRAVATMKAVGIAVVAVIFVGAAWLWSSSGGPSTSGHPANSEQSTIDQNEPASSNTVLAASADSTSNRSNARTEEPPADQTHPAKSAKQTTAIKSPEEVATEIEKARAATNNGLGRWMNPQDFEHVMEIEPRDEAWAAAVEAELNDYIADHFSDGEFETRVVECRESTCRITALVDFSDAVQGSNDAWQRVVGAIEQELPWLEFQQGVASFISDSKTQQILISHYLSQIPPGAPDD